MQGQCECVTHRSLQDKLFQIAKVNNLRVDTLPTEGGGGLPLGNGSWSGCVGVLKTLHDFGAKMNVKDNKGYTCAHVAAQYGQTEFLYTMKVSSQHTETSRY